MDARNDGTSRRTAPARAAIPRRLSVLWGLLLSASIVSTGLGVLPAPACRAVLWLIGIGFVLFAIARGSMHPVETAPSTCAHLLPPGMRRIYWLGYALMAAGVLTAGLVAAAALLA